MHKKILFISDHGDPLAPLGSEQAGGQNNYVKQLALALERKGNRVDVVTHWANPSDPQIETFSNFCRVIRIGAGSKTYIPKNKMLAILPDFYEEMGQTIKIASYDLVHTHYWLSGLLGTFVKKDYRLPWIHTNHSLGVAKESATGIAEPTRLTAEKLILSSTDSIVATTENEKSLIRSFVYNPSPITVIPIGTANQFQPFFNEAETATHPYFAFAGRLEKTKGIYTLVNAFRRLVEKQDIPASTKLIIAGGDSENVNVFNKLPKKTKLKTAIIGLESRIDFIGSQSQQQLASLFNNAVATIVPSYYESFGMVAAEAQACGSPVIASKVGGLKDVVKNRITGLHIEKGNEKSLAYAMKTLLSNPTLANELGKKAATFANLEFKWPVLAKRMDTLYEVVINEKKTLYAGDRSRRYASR
ncbi:glycosyltransferase [Sporosarcina sp. FSL K6-1508]|uniref:glycosyltransferase n=1 Tax=Sporosarcina sp. FSL K6-1508 TaxID=2921553 RepID=UPI0030FB8A7A